MLQNAARKVLTTYLSEGRIPALSEIGIGESEYARSKDPVFVTLYKDGKVVASSGRIHAKNENSAKEMVENALLCLKDPRLSGLVGTAADLQNVRIRVDVLPASKRRVLANVAALDPKKEGIIFLAQGLGKLSVVLPNIANLTDKAEDLFSIAIQKTGLDPKTLKEGDYVIYGIQTEAMSDF